MASGSDGTGQGEFERIRRHLRPLAAGDAAARDLTDDGALLPQGSPGGWVVTTDSLVAGVHFLPDDPPDSLALKLLGVNLSDLAAMGARPAYYSLNLALPASCGEAWWRGLAAGLRQGQERHGLCLLGGDCSTTSGPATLSATLFGTPPAAGPLGRGGVRAGDRLWVTGTIGDAGLGLKLLTGELSPEAAGLTPSQARYLADRYRHPRPRWRLAQRLAPWLSAAIDISDGVIADLGHMVQASGVGAELTAAAMPLSPAAQRALAAGAAAWPELLTAGDDYELAVASSPGREVELRAAAASLGVALTPIGKAVSGRGVACYDAGGRAMAFDAGGWEHAAGGAT